MNTRYMPEVALLHTSNLSEPEVVLRSAGISEPFNLHSFSVLPAGEIEDSDNEARPRLERVMENIRLSHLLIQDRLMQPMAEMAKLAIGFACWYSPTQEGFVFGTFNDDNDMTQMPLERAKDMAQFIEIPDLSTVLDGDQ